MTYKPNPTIVEGGETKVQSNDEALRALLRDVLKEIQKSNLHLSVMSDIEIQSEDITNG